MPLSEFRLIAPPPTPFQQDGSLNLAGIEPLFDLLQRTGVDGVFVAGSTGECSSLTIDERVALTQRWVDVARPADFEVNVQVGDTCQADALLLAQRAQAIGVDAVSAHAPNYLKPDSVERLIEFLAPIAAAAGDLPFYFYDIPGATHVQLDMLEFLATAKDRIPNLAGLKYSHMDLMQLQRCVEFHDGEFELLFGCDQALLAGIVLGARGAIGSTYNFAASWFRGMIELLQAGDLEGARRRQARAVEWIVTMQPYGFLAACKVLLEALGVPGGPVRPPLANMNAAERDTMLSRLEEQGLFEAIQPASSATVTR